MKYYNTMLFTRTSLKRRVKIQTNWSQLPAYHLCIRVTFIALYFANATILLTASACSCMLKINQIIAQMLWNMHKRT